jgi:hypothetical protein
MKQASPKLRLDYYNAASNSPVFLPASRDPCYRMAIAFWGVPLALGLLNFLLWFLLRWDLLLIVGKAIISICVAAGAASLIFAGYFLIVRFRGGARVWIGAFGAVVALFALFLLSMLLTITLAGIAYR